MFTKWRLAGLGTIFTMAFCIGDIAVAQLEVIPMDVSEADTRIVEVQNDKCCNVEITVTNPFDYCYKFTKGTEDPNDDTCSAVSSRKGPAKCIGVTESQVVTVVRNRCDDRDGDNCTPNSSTRQFYPAIGHLTCPPVPSDGSCGCSFVKSGTATQPIEKTVCSGSPCVLLEPEPEPGFEGPEVESHIGI